MTYQAKRSRKVVEDFELVNENGQIEVALHVELDAGSMAEKISRKYIALLHAQKDVSNIHAEINSATEVKDAYMRLGMAVTDIIESVFGTEDTKQILEFYDNNYVDMVKEVIPFISTVVLPRLRSQAQQNKQEILSKYDRKTRRAMKKGTRRI